MSVGGICGNAEVGCTVPSEIISRTCDVNLRGYSYSSYIEAVQNSKVGFSSFLDP
jgi:hypothetical protein